MEFSPKAHRRKPLPHFYVFSLPAVELRSLCGIARRQASNVTPRAADLGIQRQHDPERSEEIAQFVEFGYPWSTLSESKRKSSEFNNLRKPGWLPTSKPRCPSPRSDHVLRGPHRRGPWPRGRPAVRLMAICVLAAGIYIHSSELAIHVGCPSRPRGARWNWF